MSFNVRGSLAKDGENRWEKRAPLNLATICKYAPDIIGLQEVQQGNWDFYERELPGYHRVRGPHYNDHPPGYGTPSIFFRPERLELIDHGGFWLGPTPHCHSPGWDNSQSRSTTWVRHGGAATSGS